MFGTQEEKENYINKLFSDVELFEWDVLNVSSNIDRAEVIEMIADTLVHDTLKNEINFLYIKDIKEINFKKIKKAIYNEIVGEWLNFCDDTLIYPKKDAILIVNQIDEIQFIYSITNSYFDKFSRIIFSKIVDTFLEYLEKSSLTKNKQIFIEKVLQSKFNENKDSNSIHKFSQLKNRVQIAQECKNIKINNTNNKIKELMEKLTNNSNEENSILLKIEDYDYEINELEKKGLYEFDEIIAKLRNNMIDSMKKLS